MAKKYNPFLMFGSYIIPILIIFYTAIIWITRIVQTGNIKPICTFVFCFGLGGEILISFGAIVIGFFIGWVVHSLIRKFR